jgi:hypothetical protein
MTNTHQILSDSESHRKIKATYELRQSLINCTSNNYHYVVPRMIADHEVAPYILRSACPKDDLRWSILAFAEPFTNSIGRFATMVPTTNDPSESRPFLNTGMRTDYDDKFLNTRGPPMWRRSLPWILHFFFFAIYIAIYVFKMKPECPSSSTSLHRTSSCSKILIQKLSHNSSYRRSRSQIHPSAI